MGKAWRQKRIARRVAKLRARWAVPGQFVDYVPASAFSMRDIFRHMHTVNGSRWHGHPAGTVRFENMQGSISGDGTTWEVITSFAPAPVEPLYCTPSDGGVYTFRFLHRKCWKRLRCGKRWLSE